MLIYWKYNWPFVAFATQIFLSPLFPKPPEVVSNLKTICHFAYTNHIYAVGGVYRFPSHSMWLKSHLIFAIAHIMATKSNAERQQNVNERCYNRQDADICYSHGIWIWIKLITDFDLIWEWEWWYELNAVSRKGIYRIQLHNKGWGRKGMRKMKTFGLCMGS